ncbi:hypothetical protein [Bacillus sp. UNC438CL73TsuS30]|uniref:hypothetical protein n=1 Tax=Bacillus sp. UNC438CL73TsuS30 TaxID=1340434 RepID=UPI00047C0940|nr:hypothetical protein [Bacillus sp. UNC438CL73TsuS30]
MGILYSSMIKVKLHQDKMHKYFIKRLQELGVTHSQLGHPVEELDYDEAKYEYTLAAFREIDAERDANRWF